MPHKTLLSSMNRAVGRVSCGETAGTQGRGFPLGYGLGAALQIMALVRHPGSILHDNVAAQPWFTAGTAGLVSAHSRASAQRISDSTTAERSARAATRWVHGRARLTRTQPAGEVSD